MPGVLVIGYHSNPSLVELTAEKFNQYLKEEGLDTVAALRARRNETGAKAHEIFTRCAKSLVLSGLPGEAQGDRRLGFPLELEAERNPYANRNGLDTPVRLTTVTLGNSGECMTAEPWRSGSSHGCGWPGAFHTAGGMWMVKAMHDSGARQQRRVGGFWASLRSRSAPPTPQELGASDVHGNKKYSNARGTSPMFVALLESCTHARQWRLVCRPVRGAALWVRRWGARERRDAVDVVFPEGRTYNVEIVTDAPALVEKLEASAGRPLTADTNPARLQGLLRDFDETFRQRVKIAFNESEVRPTISYTVAPPADASSATVAVIRLAGDVPRDARLFTWTYAWTFTSYAMTVPSAASENPASQWLEGGQTSSPFAVAPPPPGTDRLGTAWRYLRTGFTHFVPKGVDHMLFVLGIYLLRRRDRSFLWQIGAFTAAPSTAVGPSM